MTALVNVIAHLEVCYGRINSAKNATLAKPEFSYVFLRGKNIQQSQK